MFEKCVKVIVVFVLKRKGKLFLILLMIFLRGYFHFFIRFHSIHPGFVIKRHILNFSATQKIHLSKIGYIVFWNMGRKVEFLKRVQMFNSFLKRRGGDLRFLNNEKNIRTLPYIFFIWAQISVELKNIRVLPCVSKQFAKKAKIMSTQNFEKKRGR